MQQGGPIAYAYAAADGYVWALLFGEVLPMQQCGPTAYVYAAANGHVWANYVFGKCSRCNRVGLLYMHMQLLMATSGPIIFLGDIADAIGWAH